MQLDTIYLTCFYFKFVENYDNTRIIEINSNKRGLNEKIILLLIHNIITDTHTYNYTYTYSKNNVVMSLHDEDFLKEQNYHFQIQSSGINLL